MMLVLALTDGRVCSPRQAIYRWLSVALAALVESLTLSIGCCLHFCRFIVVVYAAVVIWCVCEVALSFVHAGVLVRHIVAPDG